MKYIIDFYQDLDTLNLIIFWGIIIVIILLVVVIIILEKNKKNLVKTKTQETNLELDIPLATNALNLTEASPEKNDIPVASDEPMPMASFNAEEHVIEYNDTPHIISTAKDLSHSEETSSKEPSSNITTSNSVTNPRSPLPTKPYERNVLRDLSLNQTSPIGIIKNNSESTKTQTFAKDLNDSLNIEKIDSNLTEINSTINESHPIPHINNQKIDRFDPLVNLPNQNDINKSSPNKQPVEYPRNIEIIDPSIKPNENNHLKAESAVKETYNHQTITMPKEVANQNISNLTEKPDSTLSNTPLNNYQAKDAIKEIETYPSKLTSIDNPQAKSLENAPQTSQKDTKTPSYLEEVSLKLSQSQNIDQVDRTEYELRQEEEAIISYEELMQKKDQIKMIDEEDAVISIEELLQKKHQEEKLYQLTAEEENDKFLRELKDFRNDL